MVRQPDGINGKTFFQWNVPQGTPSWIRRGVLRDPDDPTGREKTVFMVDDVETLRHIANLGCIALHVLACREATREQCDFVTLDFDLGGQPLSVGDRARPHAEGAARRGRAHWLPEDQRANGPARARSGRPRHQLHHRRAARRAPRSPGHRIATRRSPRWSASATSAAGVLYVDTEQTGQSRTIVSPYSVRAFPGASVSTPLDWRELSSALDPRRYTIMTVPERIATIGDPLATLLDQRPDIAVAVAKLGARLTK